MVTPCGGQGFSLEQQLMAARLMRQEGGGSSSSRSNVHITPAERAEISMAVFGILRDNLPPALESSTTQEDLLQIAKSIESKLYQTAPSPRAYSAYSTLEFRITALATAVLIHSDKDDNGSNNSGGGVSDTCARLSAAARKSLVYCVMVLVSYETKNLNKKMMNTRGGGNTSNNMASNIMMMMNRQSYGASPTGNNNCNSNNSYSQDYHHQSSVKQSPGSYSRSDSNKTKIVGESKQVQNNTPAA